MFIIKGDQGWLYGFLGNNPIWTDFQLEAIRLDSEQVEDAKQKLAARGYSCQIISV